MAQPRLSAVPRLAQLVNVDGLVGAVKGACRPRCKMKFMVRECVENGRSRDRNG